jgi:16S rRNA (cytidine1402-2'-O)-methyltransferase
MIKESGRLYIVATPIGNLSDITLRALDILNKVDLILCEDTRVTKVLLRHHMVDKSLLVYNDHSDENLRKKIIDKLLQGQNLALVSDAGTPLISDPGYKLIQELKQRNIKVETLPGPCSVIAALTIAGLPTDRFMFVGFLPHKVSAKETLFSELKTIQTTLVCFEAANRLIDSLETMKAYFNNRDIAVVREISKLFEESTCGTIEEVMQYYQENQDKLRGEIVLCIGPSNGIEENNDDEIIEKLTKLMQKMSLRDAVDAFSSQHKLPKKQIYKLALTI